MTSPLGVNNLNQLVEQQLGNTGYEVVRTIYNNIDWLYATYQAIPNLGSITQALPYVDLLARNISNIETLVQNLNTIDNLNSNLHLVQELAPRIQAFKESLDEYRYALNANNTKVDKLQSLYDDGETRIRNIIYATEKEFKLVIEKAKAEVAKEVMETICITEQFHKEVKEQHTELVNTKGLINKYLSTATENNKMLKHLMASDAVNTYLWEQNDEHKKVAQDAIRASEKAGNTETTNRHKMKATKSDLNLFKVLNRNNLELANKNIAGSVQQKETCNG